MHISDKARAVKASSTLAIDTKFKEMKAKGIDVVGFGTGEPDFDTPDNIKEAAIRALKNGATKYTPAAGTLSLKKAVCHKFLRDNNLKYRPDNIVISNGAKHSLMNVFTAICNPGNEVIVPAPYWVSYPEMIRLADGIPIIVETNIYVISDEVYEHIIYDGNRHISIASFGDKIKKLTVTVNAVSKTYAMTGWRIGYLGCTSELAKAISNIQSHATSCPNSIAQAAAEVALMGSLDNVRYMNSEFKKRRDYMVEKINSIDGISCLKPNGAFYVMMNISKIKGTYLYGKKICTSDDFAELFLEKSLVAVVPCSGFGDDDFIRWSYANSMESIVKGLDRLEKFINEGKKSN